MEWLEAWGPSPGSLVAGRNQELAAVLRVLRASSGTVRVSLPPHSVDKISPRMSTNSRGEEINTTSLSEGWRFSLAQELIALCQISVGSAWFLGPSGSIVTFTLI